MERRMKNIKVSVIIARGLAQWRSQALIETKTGQINQLHTMYVPLMRRCCMGAHTGPAGILVFILWSPLTSLPNSDRSAPQLGTAIGIN